MYALESVRVNYLSPAVNKVVAQIERFPNS